MDNTAEMLKMITHLVHDLEIEREQKMDILLTLILGIEREPEISLENVRKEINLALDKIIPFVEEKEVERYKDRKRFYN